MLRIIVVIVILTLLVGCSESDQVDQKIRSAIEAGRVTNWRAPSLSKLEQALSLCDQPILAKKHGSGCAACADDAAVFAEARFHCTGVTLPLCHKARGIIAAGPPAFSERIAGYTGYDNREEFKWYQSPHNPLLERLFSMDDRLELLQIAIRKHALVLVMMVLMMGAAWWLTDRYRRRLEQDELNLVTHKAELAAIHLSQQMIEAETAKTLERARKLELRTAEQELALERHREELQCERRQAEKRQHRSLERERIMRMFGDSD